MPLGYSNVYEKEYIRKDGTIFPVELRTYLVRDESGNPNGMWAFVRDITERKRAQDQLEQLNEQLRALAANIQFVREEESTRIAREIHDELGQVLTGIKMDMSFLEETIADKIIQGELSQLLLNKLISTSNLVDSAIQTIRKISTELRPAVLDNVDIIGAIEWQAEEFENRTKIKCEYNVPTEGLELDKTLSTAIFRILQESLTNVTRHAKANKVNISLAKKDNNLILIIDDNGRGITENEKHKVETFGLIGMRERTLLLGGNIEVFGVQGKGTTIKVTIPIKNDNVNLRLQ